jgi:hypothetical protein
MGGAGPAVRPYPCIFSPAAPSPQPEATCILWRPSSAPGLAGCWWNVGRAFAGKTVALRPGAADDRYAEFFRHQHVPDIDLADEEE